MAHKRTCIHEFRCEEHECLNHIRFTFGVRKSAAVRFVRKLGWAAHNGEHYCPVHNQKGEPEEDPAGHYRVESFNYDR